ncbi:mucin-5AC [Lampris incognitus]|uniref:mucin-5AC n=1 Tax=Lampris incognitus TaxID=2546036 RepID=UPI0024B61DB8|nr:mucin-5AC [Lampris incognitus]
MKPNGGAKPNGVAKETMEPTEGAGAESSISQEQVIVEEVTEPASSTSQPEEAVNSTAAPTGQEAHGKSASAASDPKAKRKAPASKTKYGAIAGVTKTVGVSNPSSRPGTSPHRAVNGFKALNSSQASVTTVKTASSLIGAMPKMRVGAPAPSFNVSKSQTQMADKRTAEPVRKTSAAAATTVTNSSRPAAAKKQTAGPVNGTRPKTTAPVSKPSASTTQKPNPSAAARAERTAVHKTSRPATGSAAAQPASKPPSGSGGTGTTTKTMSSTAGTKPAASRFPTTSSAGRTTAAQISKTATTAAAAKRSVGVLRTDVGRPAFTTAAKKPATAAPTKRPEPPKPATTSQRDTSFKRPASTKTVEPKLPQPKTKHAKDIPPKKEGRLPAMNKPSMGKPTPASQASKLTTSGTPQRKHPKQPQAVLTSTTTDKKAANSITAAEKPSAAAATVTVSTADIVELTKPAEAAAAYKEPEVISPTPEVSAQEEVPIPAFTQKIPAEVVLQKATLAAAPSPPSPVQTAIPPTSSSQSLLESTDPSGTTHVLTSAPLEEVITPVNHSPTPAGETLHPTQHQAPSTSEAPSATPVLLPPKVNSPTNLNEEEDEEEREGSQQVSVSEMSGTTQLTEESRPGSAGPVGGAAWRAGGALFSELDSEEVSGSQQGASELSAPGVLEGTESIDDLGDASFKGAIDMEGASVGSPDFERVPDIPTTDFDEDDDEDDEDRVCDMDVGSERADDPCTPRHVNEVDDEDDDVEMASEGITESGLESYGNADEDDLAEDERLDNLNRVAQPPPPPPLLPSAPAAQWDQPNPFADPWAQPLVPQQPLVHLAQPVQPSAVAEGPVSPSANLWQADFETQTQSAAQAWLQVDSAAFSLQIHDDSNSSSVQDEQPNSETQGSTDQPGIGSMQTLVLAASSAPPMSLSSTLSSDTSTPDDSCDPQLHIQETQAPLLSFKHYPKDQDLGAHLQMEGDGEREEGAEAEILPDNEVLGGPLTAPTSNLSSSSTTEDDASDVEGEAELEDPMEGHGISANLTFDSQPRNLRCLSAPEAEVEADGSLGGDATPLSANSMASYGFDSSMTTASNSNAQSTGESCTKSPGIFSLEELPEEAKDPSLIQELPAEPSLAEQHYMHCGKQDAEPAEDVGVEVSGSDAAPDVPLSRPEDDPNDLQPPYYSAICEKTENSFAGNV